MREVNVGRRHLKYYLVLINKIIIRTTAASVKFEVFCLSHEESNHDDSPLDHKSADHPIVACLLFFFLIGPGRALTHDEWYRGLDLESALAESGLVLVGRVTDVSETKIGVGGKGERSLLQYKFEPVFVLKGVFSRDCCCSPATISARNNSTRHAAPIEAGQLRLLV